MTNTLNCENCNSEFTPKRTKSKQRTCSKSCGYKIRVIVPNSGQFKKGNKPPFQGKHLPIELREKLSKIRLQSKFRGGEFHPRWKGGKRGYFGDEARRILISEGYSAICNICYTNKDVTVHHKNKNWKDNSSENLTFLCRSCHLKHHHKSDKTRNNCIECKSEFFSGRISKKYCSQKCNGRAFRKRRNLKLIGETR